MLNDSILTLTTFIPAAGAAIVTLLPRRGRVIQWFTLAVTLLVFGLSLHLPAHYVSGRPGFQYEVDRTWIASLNIHYHVGVDGISLWLVVLSTLLGVVGVLASWTAIADRTKEFYFFFLLQQTAVIGVLVALDLFLYYDFWELTLVPMAVLIATFGRERGPQVAVKFFLYTFLPSALLLAAILWLYAKTGTFDFVRLQAILAHDNSLFSSQALLWISLAFLAAFAVKVPVFPLHGWLSDTFSEAPTAMAMVVAGKLGLYSILRFNLGLFPAQARQAAPWMIALAAVGILYGALLALAQKDLKRLAAYASLSSLSFCTLGIFSFSTNAVDGAVFQTISEGLIGGGLLVLLGFLYERYATLEIASYGGLAVPLPRLATLFVITSLALIGLPLLSGFVGEFLVLSGSFPAHPGWVSVATVGVILSAAYMLGAVQRVFYGGKSALVSEQSTFDLGLRERLAVWPMAILMLAMGIASPLWMRAIDGSVSALIRPAVVEGPPGMAARQ